jgi:hypothetical protein
MSNDLFAVIRPDSQQDHLLDNYCIGYVSDSYKLTKRSKLQILSNQIHPIPTSP